MTKSIDNWKPEEHSIAAAPSAPARRVRKTGGSFQHTGTIVSEFVTTRGERRIVLEFDPPVAGMLHVYRPDQVEPLPDATPSAPAPDDDPLIFAIVYDDADMRYEIVHTEAAARARFKRISDSWNAHLFVKVASNSRDDRHANSNAVFHRAGAPAPAEVPMPEPVAYRIRHRSEPGMVGHYPWSYADWRASARATDCSQQHEARVRQSDALETAHKLRGEVERVRGVLRELVACEDLKIEFDTMKEEVHDFATAAVLDGIQAEYLRRKPVAVAAARAELGDDAETARRREKEKLMGGIL